MCLSNEHWAWACSDCSALGEDTFSDRCEVYRVRIIGCNYIFLFGNRVVSYMTAFKDSRQITNEIAPSDWNYGSAVSKSIIFISKYVQLNCKVTSIEIYLHQFDGIDTGCSNIQYYPLSRSRGCSHARFLLKKSCRPIGEYVLCAILLTGTLE